MCSARLISFKAEGPLLYEVGACFGYAKAAVLLLGLEGIETHRVVAFDYRLSGRSCLPYFSGSRIALHSYLYLRIDGYDYIYDPTYVGESSLSVGDSVTGERVFLSIYRDFCIGLTFDEHRKIWGGPYPDKDVYAASDEYNPGSYRYLTEFTYDGTHDLIFSTAEEARDYYAYLMENVFSGAPEFRTVTLFYVFDPEETWNARYKEDLKAFLSETGLSWKYAYTDITDRSDVPTAMVKIAFGR